MLPTPSTSHVNYNQVYEPAEDSYLLLDTLSSPSEVQFLQARFAGGSPSPVIVEIGPGSGVVLAFVTAQALKILGRSDIATLGIDVNPLACVATRETVNLAAADHLEPGQAPAVFLDTIVGDLAAAIRPESVDMLIFNPPYVPSEELPAMPIYWDDTKSSTRSDQFSRDAHLLSLSTDGGVDGMETTNRLLSQLEAILTHRGVAYVLLCAQNRPDKVMADIGSWRHSSSDGNQCKWRADKVSSSGNKAGWERLCVVRICREPIVTAA